MAVNDTTPPSKDVAEVERLANAMTRLREMEESEFGARALTKAEIGRMADELLTLLAHDPAE